MLYGTVYSISVHSKLDTQQGVLSRHYYFRLLVYALWRWAAARGAQWGARAHLLFLNIKAVPPQ